jgi:hypothetical protein
MRSSKLLIRRCKNGDFTTTFDFSPFTLQDSFYPFLDSSSLFFVQNRCNYSATLTSGRRLGTENEEERVEGGEGEEGGGLTALRSFRCFYCFAPVALALPPSFAPS